MEEGAKVRVVRCPKCENLLPEVPNLPVYVCGGCGAYLQAKIQERSNNGSSVKSEEKRGKVSSDKMGVLNLSDNGSEMSDRGEEDVLERRGGERGLIEKAEDSESRKQKREVLVEVEATRRNGLMVEEEKVRVVTEKVGGLNMSKGLEMSDKENDSEMRRKKYEMAIPDRGYNSLLVKSEEEEGRVMGVSNTSKGLEMSDMENDGVVERRQRRYEKILPDSGSREVLVGSSMALRYDPRSLEEDSGKYRRRTDNWVSESSQELNRKNRGKFVGNESVQNEDSRLQYNSLSGSRVSGQMADWHSREGTNVYRRTPRAVTESVRFSATPYERQSDYYCSSSYEYGGGSVKSHIDSNVGGADRVEYLEQDRAELLRKLNELKNQISGDMMERPKERVPVPLKERPRYPYVGRDTWFPETLSRASQPSYQSLPYNKNIQRHSYYTNSHEPIPLMNRHDMDLQNFYHPNDISGYGDHFGHQMPGRVPNQPYSQYRQYMDVDTDQNLSYLHNTFFHQPECSCFQCYSKQQQLPSQLPPPPIACNRRFTDPQTNSTVENIRSYNPREREANSPPLQLREPKTIGVGRSRPQRKTIVNKNLRRCRPIAGGAPYITCSNCYELLPIPKKLVLVENTRKKLKCGACSTIITFIFESSKLVFLPPSPINEVATCSYPTSAEVEKEMVLHSPDQVKGSIIYSDDHDNSGYNFQSTDTENVSSPMDQRINSSDSDKIHRPISSSSSVSEDSESHESTSANIEILDTAEMPLKVTPILVVPRSPVHENSDHLVSKFGNGSRSKRINQDEVVILTKAASTRHVKDPSMATEINVSFDEYSNTGMSQDSREVTTEEERPKNSKVTSFMGLIKKGFRDHSRSTQTIESEKSNVSVNGQFIPERLVKKAEKLAGPIRNGHYWYDARAGFWGVMGHPCLGVIPPCIEEFSHPISRNCAGGNTGVVVNGRELHVKDLNLLANRGLPVVKDRSYTLEICGRVVDEESGEELDSLGKLAPTVEKVKHGFGMRVPRKIS